MSGVFLTHTGLARARTAQAALGGAVPVVTDAQTVAAAATAAALTSLARAGTAAGAGRVVIVGAERNPLVAALAGAAGIGEIDSFGLDEAHEVRLRTATRRAAAVIDLAGVVALSRPAPAVVAVEPAVALLALPGLLDDARAAERPASLADCLSGQHGPGGAHPAGRLLPPLSDPRLAVGEAATAQVG